MLGLVTNRTNVRLSDIQVKYMHQYTYINIERLLDGGLRIFVLIDIYGKCRTMNPSTNTSTTSTGNIQGCSQKK